MKKLSVKTQFRIGTALILFFFCGGFSLLEYQYLKAFVTQSIYRETELHVATADATRTYVKDVLRPRMNRLLPPDEFIPEAMSTTYLGREIMGRIHQQFPDFEYKRAAKNPVNPVNMADGFEMEMLEWFERHPQIQQWSGITRKGNRSYYAQLRAIYAEAECLSCHGEPVKAPKRMREMYGERNGYGYRVGEVVAADSIFIPVDVMFLRIKEKAMWVFIIGIASLLFLFGLFFLLFNRTVVSQLKGLIATFSSISGEDPGKKKNFEIRPADEIEQLKETFEAVAQHLKQAHDELKASEVKYRRLFEASQDAIVICDPKGRLVDINPSGLVLFGFKARREALGVETFHQLFLDGDEAAAILEAIQKDGHIKEKEALMVDGLGTQRMVLITANQRKEETGEPGGFVAVLRDITEKRKLDQHLAQTEKLAAIGQLAAGVAHEINNPLGVIMLYSHLIEKHVAPDSQVRRDLQVIHKHSSTCKAVVESLLSFARVSEPKKVPCNLHEVIDEVLSVLEHRTEREKIRIIKRYADPMPQIIADAGQLKQVFMNLFINAFQAMPDGGTVTIETRPEKEALTVRISDTGSGIEKPILGRIFEPFFTTKDPGTGTGLGLSVSYGIVRQHEGEIEVESVPGKGTTFTLSLPH